MTSIFISHSSTDKDFVKKLARDITRHGGTAWVDEAEMNVGDSLIKKIGAGIDETEFLGVVLSPASVRSEWVQREVEVALNQEIKGKKVKVLPLLKRRCDIPIFLNGKVYADFSRTSRYTESLARLIAAMGLDPENKGRVPGKKMIRVKDFREKISNHFAPRSVEIEFFEDGGGLAGISVWNEDKTFEHYSWETMPTDMELLTEIFCQSSDPPIKDIGNIDGGPFSTSERDFVVESLKTKYELGNLPMHKWKETGGAALKALDEYQAWLFEVSILCLSPHTL